MTIVEEISRFHERARKGEVFDFEATLEHVYRRWIRPGNTVIDVGAHRGRHLGPMLECVGNGGKVIAYEPLPFAFADLRSTFQQSNVFLFNCALGDRTGDTSFVHARGTPEESGLRQRIFNNPDNANPETINVKVSRLDDHTRELESIDYIKMDIEGGEIDCLRGAEKTLRTFRPLVSVEYGWPGYTAYGYEKSTLFDIASSLGFSLFDLFGNPIKDKVDWDHACDTFYWDYLMVPIERVEEFVATQR